MSFQYSVIGDNTKENREHLEKIGYEDISEHQATYEGLLDCDNYDSTFFSFKNSEYGEKYSKVLCDLGYINCIGKPQLFKAVSAMRSDSDYMQYFVENVNLEIYDADWVLCQTNYFCHSEYTDTSFHKATLSELEAHFQRV